MSDLDIFKNEFVPNIETHAKLSFDSWKKTAPADYARWVAYRDALLAGQSPAAPSMTTKYGKALVAAGKLVAVSAPPPPPPPPPITWEGQKTISAGGTYTGNWETTTGISVVVIATDQPVVIRNSRIRCVVAGNHPPLIGTSYPLNLTLENCFIEGTLTPAARLLDVDRWTNFTMRNCTIDRTAGCSFSFPGVAGATMLVTKNRHTNVNKANATVADTHGQFIQVRDTQGATIEISWNEIVNEPELCWSEDLISIIGTSNVSIHDNYIQHISAPNYQVCTQGAVTVENGSANVQVLNNQMVDVPAAIGWYGGTGGLAQGNRIIQDGYYPDGVHRIVEGWAGCYVAAGTNNRIDGNTSGYVNKDGSRLDWDPNSAYNLASTNTTLPDPITRQMELDEWPRWQSKLATAGITVGAS